MLHIRIPQETQESVRRSTKPLKQNPNVQETGEIEKGTMKIDGLIEKIRCVHTSNSDICLSLFKKECIIIGPSAMKSTTQQNKERNFNFSDTSRTRRERKIEAWRWKGGLGIWVVIYQDGRQGPEIGASYDERDLSRYNRHRLPRRPSSLHLIQIEKPRKSREQRKHRMPPQTLIRNRKIRRTAGWRSPLRETKKNREISKRMRTAALEKG